MIDDREHELRVFPHSVVGEKSACADDIELGVEGSKCLAEA